MAVLQAKQILPGAVHLGNTLIHHLQTGKAVILLKLLPKRYGQAAHIVKSFCQLHMHPVTKAVLP
mgnify:CR=1 FL=1